MEIAESVHTGRGRQIALFSSCGKKRQDFKFHYFTLALSHQIVMGYVEVIIYISSLSCNSVTTQNFIVLSYLHHRKAQILLCR